MSLVAPQAPAMAPAAAPARPKWQRWWQDSAAGRIATFVAVAVGSGAALGFLLRLAGWTVLPKSDGLRIAADVLLRIVPMVAAYLVVARFLEKRAAAELAWRRMVPDTAAGFAAGAALLGAVIGALSLAGGYAVTGIGTDVAWLRPLLVLGFATAVAEEILFRGVLFRTIAGAWGPWVALAVSALFFGAVHLGNSNASAWTSFAIAVEAGVLLGVVYHVTGSLWACIGLHAAWNFSAGTVFGSPVSGTAPASSWLHAQFPGPDWLTGGAFGIEGSVVTVALCLAASAALLAAARRLRAHNQRIA